MKYLKFDKAKLTNLEYSTAREYIRTNRAGSYASTTIVGCNTRKYHGLLICPVKKYGNEKYVFLSSLDESIIQKDTQFNFGIHKYGFDNYYPTGHVYVADFEAEYDVKTTFRVGGVELTKEFIMVNRKEQVIVKYTLTEASCDTVLRLQPFLANRRIHDLSHANISVDTRYTPVCNGIRSQMYRELPPLYLQTSKSCDFVPAPDWYYGVEYSREMERGYDYKEDLFVPGYFEIPLKKGETVFVSASLQEIDPSRLGKLYAECLSYRLPRNSFENCLKNSAQQFFVVGEKDRTEVIAGFPWFGAWGRDTFIALPGLSLSVGNQKRFEDTVDTMVGKMKNGLFPNMGNDDAPAFNSVDAPLWFFTALQAYGKYLGDDNLVWKKYSEPMKRILEAYAGGSLPYNIHMDPNGLIWQGEEGKALTWMDAVVSDGPVTPRMGFAVEINLLWYNAVCWMLDMAGVARDEEFVSRWEGLPDTIARSFIEMFWSEKDGYLADVSDGNNKDMSLRPNQIFAASLDYSPLDKEKQKKVLDKVRQHLLTPRGLRTLAPEDARYCGTYEGDQETRDRAYHQGTVWPWLLGPYSKGWMKVHRHSGYKHVQTILEGFEEDMTHNGISSISEVYDGNPPFHGKGAVSQAWSVAALLEMFALLKDYNA